MIFMNLKIYEMYGLSRFEYDFNYKKKSKFSEFPQSIINFDNINYKKMNIIMGANASGKTSIGKSLCFIQNFLIGKTLQYNDKNSLYGVQKDIDIEYGFEVVFIVEETMFKVYAMFKGDNLIREKWNKIKINDYTSYDNLLNKLNESLIIHEYNKYEKNEQITYEIKSSFLSINEHLDDLNLIKNNTGFFYRFANFNFLVKEPSIKDMNTEFLEKVLKAFDKSIIKVSKSEEIENEVLITFSNGVIERVKDGAIEQNSILSAGTKEAIILSSILYYIHNNDDFICYIDEQMAFSHSEIEQAITKIIMKWIANKNAQVFITTHNSAMLDIDLPTYNYSFIRRCKDNKNIEVIHPELEIAHRSRSLRSMVEKDVFSLGPEIESLVDLMEEE